LAHEIKDSLAFIQGRGNTYCRGCLEDNLFSALDLGSLPIANELLLTQENEAQKFPLHLKICTNCGLGQVADVVSPERIFRDYRYLSSMSTTFLKHASDFVDQQIANTSFSNTDWVLEIASNDGYLLRNFTRHGIKTLGIEPAKNVAEISRDLGIETISEFFTSELASRLLIRYGHPKLIVANNVMAHVPDIRDFIKGLAILCGPHTRISVENPAFSNILLGMQFDTVYHEHYSYLSATSVARLSEMHGLTLFEVEQLEIHGGSNRYWLKKSEKENYVVPSVERILSEESTLGLFDSDKWNDLSYKVSKVLIEFKDFLDKGTKGNKRILGYGAAAKASTLLNSVDATPNLIRAIADISPEKQGRFMPANGIAIISPAELLVENPTDVVVFPWNIKLEIANMLRSYLGDQVRLWCLIPEMHEVE
jgi:hypothetical protein